MASKPTPEKPDVNHKLYALVTRLHSDAHRDLFRAIAAEELSYSQLQLLDYLRRRPSQKPTIQQAAAIMGIKKASASRITAELAQRGLITREAHESDNRSKRIVITERGAQTIVRLHEARFDRIRAFTAELAPEARDELDKVLSTLTTPPAAAPPTARAA